VLLVVEVLSASTRKHDLEFKRKQYASVGIPSYWIVDPLVDRVTFTQLLLAGGGVYAEVLQTDELVTVHEPWEVTLDLPAWTGRRDRIRERSSRRPG
jgi:Uma2 family endonuclease